MPLQGTLESFGISEIFQLVSQQGKTGTLEIDTGQGVARVRFLEGRLVEAWPDQRSPSELIGNLLVRGGLVTQTQLDHALGVQRESLRPLGDILIRIGALRIAEFQEMLALQHRETVYRILLFQRGKFFFRSEPVEVEEGVSAPLDVGSLLMEGFRQIDEWPRLRERVPGDGRVCVRTDAAPPELSAEQARLLSVVDGAGTVRQLVDRSRLGEFVAREVLIQLLELGLVATVEAERAEAPAPRRRSAPWARDAALAAALALVGVLALVVGLASPTHPISGAAKALREARASAAAEQERARAWASERPLLWPGGARAAVSGRDEGGSAGAQERVPAGEEGGGAGGPP